MHEVQQEGLILAKSTHDKAPLLGHLRQLNLDWAQVRVTWYPNSRMTSSAHEDWDWTWDVRENAARNREGGSVNFPGRKYKSARRGGALRYVIFLLTFVGWREGEEALGPKSARVSSTRTPLAKHLDTVRSATSAPKYSLRTLFACGRTQFRALTHSRVPRSRSNPLHNRSSCRRPAAAIPAIHHKTVPWPA